MHEVYLPFTEGQLLRHFAPVNGSKELIPERFLNYYKASIRNWCGHADGCSDRRGKSISELKLPYQMEKDERFWVVTCLMKYFYSDDRVGNFAKLLQSCFGEKPPIEDLLSWEDCLTGKLRLYFEVSLPSPPSYKEWLKENIKSRHMVPYVLDAACKKNSNEIRLGLEGPTHVDAILLNEKNGFAVIFEAKVLSDISSQITFDVTRNQIARNIDVMLEKNDLLPEPLRRRDPSRTLFALLTPKIFKDQQHTRLYSWLINEYMNSPEALKRDLPHRNDFEFSSISKRIGWLTWEDCETVLLEACSWL